MDPIDCLVLLSYAGGLLAAGCYLWGYILKPKGDRRLHVASLLFCGFGLVNLPMVLRYGAEGPAFLNATVLVCFMLAGMGCQAVSALRGRRGDRRAPERRAEDQASDAAAQPAAKAA